MEGIGTPFCSRCGNETSADSIFCNRCGARLSPELTVAGPPPAPTVVRETIVKEKGTSFWAVCGILFFILVVLGVIVLFMGGVAAVGIPGFPVESILIGIAVGLSLIVTGRRKMTRGKQNRN
jgi:hypothetical protein